MVIVGAVVPVHRIKVMSESYVPFQPMPMLFRMTLADPKSRSSKSCVPGEIESNAWFGDVAPIPSLRLAAPKPEVPWGDRYALA